MTVLPPNILKCMAKADRVSLGKAGLTTPEVAAKLALRREKELQENVANLLRQHEIVFYRARMDRRTTGTLGWPDFTFAVRGLACALECKTSEGKLSADQEQCISRMQANGWRVLVVVNEAQVVEFLTGLEL